MSTDPGVTMVLLRVEIKMCSVHLIEPPQEIFGRPVNIITTGVVREVVPERRPAELSLEEIHLVQEEDDACPHEPSRIDNRIEKHQTFHHAILECHRSGPLMEMRNEAKPLTWLLSSRSTWSYSLSATQKMMDVTSSKQWIHFFRSLRWPPTSNMLQAPS